MSCTHTRGFNEGVERRGSRGLNANILGAKWGEHAGLFTLDLAAYSSSTRDGVGVGMCVSCLVRSRIC